MHMQLRFYIKPTHMSKQIKSGMGNCHVIDRHKRDVALKASSNAVRYVLPVLWMTSCFRSLGHYR